mgnify:CR=1 FL=1
MDSLGLRFKVYFLLFLPVHFFGGGPLSKETGYNRDYGRNPYPGYDDISQTPFLFDGELYVDQLPAMARVLTLEINSETVAYPYDILQT